LQKFAIIALLICSLGLLCYLIFISFRLLRRVQTQSTMEKKQNSQMHPQIKAHKKIKSTHPKHK